MKKLFVLVSDGGDGSYYPRFTMNEKWIEQMQEKYDNDGWDEYFIGADGDGFHYETLTVADDVTLESLDIRYDVAKEE